MPKVYDPTRVGAVEDGTASVSLQTTPRGPAGPAGDAGSATWGALTGKPTTLAGFGLTAEVQALIGSEVATAAGGLTELDTLFEIIAAIKVLQDPLLQMFRGREGALVRPSPATCFTDAAGTIPATVDDTLLSMTNEIGTNGLITWDTATEQPTLKVDGDGLHYLEITGDKHAPIFPALTYGEADFGAVMVASKDDAASNGWASLVSSKGSAKGFGLSRRANTSASLTGGTVHINDGPDLEAEAGYTRGDLHDDLAGKTVLSGIERSTDLTSEEWMFYRYQSLGAVDGKFYGGLLAAGMTEAERVAAVVAMTAAFSV